MAKLGCPTCGRAYGAGTHWTIADCPQLEVEKPTVETVHARELPAAPVKVQPRTLTPGDKAPERTLTPGDRTLTRRQDKWEARQYPGEPLMWRRDYMREYMRRRRAE